MRAIHCSHRKEHRRFARVLSRSESFSKLTTKICTPPIRDESGNKISAIKKVCITRRDAYLGHRLYPWVFSAFSSCDLVAENILLRPRRCVLHANFYDDDLERIQNFSLKHSRALFCVFEKIAHRGQKTEKYQHRVNKNKNRMKNK